MADVLHLPPPVRYLDPHEEVPDVERWWWWETDQLKAEPFYDWYFIPRHLNDVRLHVLDYPKEGYLDDSPEFVQQVRQLIVDMVEGIYHWDWERCYA